MKKGLSDFARAAAEFSGRRGLFLGDSRILVALSGGPDSCAAALALVEASNAEILPRPVAAAHFHHGLRGADADADAAFCAALCARLGISCLIGLGSVPKTEKGSYSNDTARRLRYAFLEEAAEEIGADVIVTAHTADDMAETVLGRVLRGTSVDGLAGIPARRELSPGLTVVRPLLSQTRAEIEAYCAEQGVTPRHDPSNDKEIFPRVRLRRRLPELARDFNPRLTAALTRLADHAAQDSALLGKMADALWEKCLVPSDPPTVRLSVAVLRDAPPALRRRVLLRALRHATGDRAEEAATGAFVARLETLLERSRGGVSLPGGAQARRAKNYLTLERPAETPNG